MDNYIFHIPSQKITYHSIYNPIELEQHTQEPNRWITENSKLSNTFLIK